MVDRLSPAPHAPPLPIAPLPRAQRQLLARWTRCGRRSSSACARSLRCARAAKHERRACSEQRPLQTAAPAVERQHSAADPCLPPPISGARGRCESAGDHHSRGHCLHGVSGRHPGACTVAALRMHHAAAACSASACSAGASCRCLQPPHARYACMQPPHARMLHRKCADKQLPSPHI